MGVAVTSFTPLINILSLQLIYVYTNSVLSTASCIND